WVRQLMETEGRFASVEVFPAEKHGLMRDLFVGVKRANQRETSSSGATTPASTAKIEDNPTQSRLFADMKDRFQLTMARVRELELKRDELESRIAALERHTRKPEECNY